MVTEEQKSLLLSNLPGDAVRERKGGGGMTLNYVDGFYVYNELTRVFGPGGWGYDLLVLTQVVPPTEVKTQGGPRTKVAYTAQVTLHADGCKSITDVGYGSGMDRDAGAAIESATKEAVTDAVKRCARALGPHMGLALYDKQQRFVSDTTEEPEPPKEEKPKRTRKAKNEVIPSDHEKEILPLIEAAATVDELRDKTKALIEPLQATDEPVYKALVKAYVAKKRKLEKEAA